jgi:hypothetical protein
VELLGQVLRVFQVVRVVVRVHLVLELEQELQTKDLLVVQLWMVYLGGLLAVAVVLVRLAQMV